jgi:uncharacterized protein YqhQ
MGTPTYGGQAVIEGVMMRGPKDLAVAVRRPSGGIIVHTEPLTSAIYTSRFSKWPFVRGLVMLWDSLVLGTKILMFSANIAVEDDPDAKEETTSALMWGSVAFGLALAIGLFFVLPVLLVSVVDPMIQNAFWSNVIEKAFRIMLFIGYLYFVGRVPDVKRVFAYHGAEHKVINAFEAGEELTPENASRYSTAHPRCGTGFLVLVMIVSLFLFLALGQPPLVWRVVSRIALVPVVAGIAYEVMKIGAANLKNPLVKVLMAPGMAVQKLTTNEPDLGMLEVAIAALQGVFAEERARVSPEHETVSVVESNALPAAVGK